MFNHVDRDRDLRRPDDTLRNRFAVRGVATDIAVNQPRTDPARTRRVRRREWNGTTTIEPQATDANLITAAWGVLPAKVSAERAHTVLDTPHPTRRCPPLGRIHGRWPPAPPTLTLPANAPLVLTPPLIAISPGLTDRNLQCANCGPSPRGPTPARAASLPSAGFSRRRTSTTFSTTIAPCVLGGGEDEARGVCATGMSQEIGGRSGCLGPGDDVSGLQAATAASRTWWRWGRPSSALQDAALCDRIRSTTPAAALKSPDVAKCRMTGPWGAFRGRAMPRRVRQEKRVTMSKSRNSGRAEG